MSVLPVYNQLLVPDANIYFKTDVYKTMTGKNPFVTDRVILIVAKENFTKEELTSDSFYPIGVTGTIMEINTNGYMVVRTRNRVNLDEIVVYKDHSIDLTISKREDIDDLDKEDITRRLKAVKNSLVKFTEDRFGNMSRGYIAPLSSLGEVATTMSPWIMNSNEERYEILAEDSLAKRADMLEKMIYENMEMSRIEGEAKNAQEEEYQKIYRESALKKQIDYLQKELDDLHPENVSDIRRLEIKIKESGMNSTARKEADKVLNRLKQESQNSAESGMLYDYLDFITSLSWKKENARTISLEKAEKILTEDHFGLKKVKNRILQQIAVMNLKQQQSGSIILFVGAPGTGKTSIGQSIAKALDRKYVRVSLGGVRDEADIRGHRRTYIGAMAGRIMDGIQKSGVSNPVMVLDEVDKMASSYNGDPASALLEVLDPEQNGTFTDHYMNVPYDLSDVLFICTANSLDTIPQPLLDRMEVIQFQGYTPLEKLQIAKRHLLPKAMEAVGITKDQISIKDSVLEAIIAGYTREAGVRGLKKRMDTLCRTAAVKLVSNHTDLLEVREEDLHTYLEMHPIRHGLVKEGVKAGVVTGLAWTAVGGEILFIETLLTKGKGRLVITGQLGEIMKESAQIAVSLVKNLFPKHAEKLEEMDLHIHVPDGATPKDGPSAGITLTTALSSLLTGIAVDHKVAMTGEVSLQGHVNPIGGLPEKLMAAQRAGAKRIFIPEANIPDLEDVAAEIKDQLEITPVHHVEELLQKLQLLS